MYDTMTGRGLCRRDAEDLVESMFSEPKPLQEKRITIQELDCCTQTYEQSLTRYTYLSS